jgi:hypothetical protein
LPTPFATPQTNKENKVPKIKAINIGIIFKNVLANTKQKTIIENVNIAITINAQRLPKSKSVA